MRNHLAAIAVLATACTGDFGLKDTGTATTTEGNCVPIIDNNEDGYYDGPINIDIATVDCNGNTVRFYAETQGWTDGGWVFSQETGNQSSGGQWSDEHDLEAYDNDACGNWDRLQRELSDASTMNDPINEWNRNQSTVFDCDAHYGDPNVMTYAFAVVDIDGNFASCIIYGDDPSGLKNDNYQRAADPSFDAQQCVNGVNTMTN